MARPREFDTEAALDAAMGAFWENGYEGTSMTALLAAMGIQKGSFYAAFESKHAVYVEGMDRYLRRQGALFRDQMEGLPGLEALRSHFRGMVQAAIGVNGHLGCYVLNGVMELAGRDPAIAKLVQEALAKQRALYREKIDAAVADGSLPRDTDADALSAALLGLLMGLQSFARGGLPRSWAHDLGRRFEDMLSPA